MACASRVGGAKRDDKETARDDFVVSPAGWLQAAVELEDTGIHKYVYIYIHVYTYTYCNTQTMEVYISRFCKEFAWSGETLQEKACIFSMKL